MIEDHVVEDNTDHDEIRLWGFDFNFFDRDKKGEVREGSTEFPYLLILMKLWTGYWKNQSKKMNLRVDQENGKEMFIGNGWYQKICRFSSNAFWKKIGCLISDPTFGFGGSRL